MALEAVEVGTTLYDSDPRRLGRTLTIQRIDDTFAFCINGSMQTTTITRAQFRNLNPGERATFMASDGVVSDDRQVRIRLDRIHSDGKPRRQGFSTIAPARPIRRGCGSGCDLISEDEDMSEIDAWQWSAIIVIAVIAIHASVRTYP